MSAAASLLPHATTTSEGSVAKPLLRVDQLTKVFYGQSGWLKPRKPDVQAVSHVSFTVQAGETVGLVGESGCGKSTLGRCILQLIRPTSGQVWLDGTELTGLGSRELREKRRAMQMIFQNPYSSLNPRMTVGQALAEPFEIHRLGDRAWIRQQVAELLEQVGLTSEMANRFPHEFSGGQRQRVGIARALALKPQLIVADEPVSALDVSVQAQILNLLDALKRQYGLTYLFVAHNLDVVRYLCDRVMVMYLGEVVEGGATEAVYTRPLHPYTQALLQAAPVPDPVVARERRAARALVSGEPASPTNPPPGCRFHTRCPHATAICHTDSPVVQEFEPGHWVRCHHAGQWADNGVTSQEFPLA